MTSIDFSGLSSLTQLTISRNHALTSIDFPGLSSLTQLNISRNHALTSIDFSGLSSLTQLNIGFNDALTSIDFSGLSSLTQLTIGSHPAFIVNYGTGNNALTSIDFSGLSSLTQLIIGGNRALTSIDFSGLSSLTQLIIGGNPFAGSLSSGGQGNDALTSIDFSGLSSLTQLTIEGNRALTSIDFSGLSSLTSLTLNIEGNDVLTSIDFSGLSSLTSLTLNIEGNDVLTSIDFSGLSSLTQLTIEDNRALTSIDFSGLSSLTQLTIIDNDALTSIDFSGLSSLTQLTIADNDALTSIDFSLFPGLVALDRLSITYNGNLRRLIIVNLPNLTFLYISYNPKVEVMDLINLPRLKTLEIHDVGTLEKIDLSDLNLPTPSEDPTNPPEDPTNPPEDPTNPPEDPTNPSEDPTNPSEGGPSPGRGCIDLISCLNNDLLSMTLPPGDSICNLDIRDNPNLKEIESSPETKDRFKDKFKGLEEEGVTTSTPPGKEPPEQGNDEDEQEEEEEEDNDDSDDKDDTIDDLKKELENLEDLVKEYKDLQEKLLDKSLSTAKQVVFREEIKAVKQLVERRVREGLKKAAEKAPGEILKKVLGRAALGSLGPVGAAINAVSTAKDVYEYYDIFRRFKQINDAVSLNSDLILDDLSTYLARNHRQLSQGTFDWRQAFSDQTVFIPLIVENYAQQPDSTDNLSSNLNFFLRGGFEYSSFAQSDDFDLDGHSISYVLGLDFIPNASVITGANLVLTNSQSDLSDSEIEFQGTYDIQSTSLHPYVVWFASDKLKLLASLGYGRAHTELNVEEMNNVSLDELPFLETSATEEGDIFSFFSRLSFNAWQFNNSSLQLNLDASAASLLGEDIQKAGLGSSFSHSFDLQSARIHSSLDLSYFVSNSDDSALELAGSLNVFPKTGRLSLFSSARTLVFGDNHEWGVSGGITYLPAPGGEGLSASLQPSFGLAGSRLHLSDLFSYNSDLEAFALSDQTPTAYLNARLSYGFRPHNHTLLTPYTNLHFSQHSSNYTAGLRYQLDSGLDLDLSASHHNRSSGSNHNRLFLRLRSDL